MGRPFYPNTKTCSAINNRLRLGFGLFSIMRLTHSQTSSVISSTLVPALVWSVLSHTPSCLSAAADGSHRWCVFANRCHGSSDQRTPIPEARFEQEIDTVVVFGEVLIILYKFQKSTFLFSCDGFPCYAVVYNDCSKLKLKWILAYQIIIDCHLKSWSDNTPDSMDWV